MKPTPLICLCAMFALAVNPVFADEAPRAFTFSGTITLPLAAAQTELAASHKAAIEKLIIVLQVQKQFEKSLVAYFESVWDTEQLKALPQEEQDKSHKIIAKVKEVMLEMMGWEKLKPDIIEVYGKNFTEKEANDIIAHMETPVGQLLVSKEAVMVGDVMAMTQEKMKNVMPKLMQIMRAEADNGCSAPSSNDLFQFKPLSFIEHALPVSRASCLTLGVARFH